MIGNDIVDLKQAAKDSNWQRPRFLDKVFTAEEQQYIHKETNPFEMVWLLWSMKESAYKAYLQKEGVRFFNPKILVCELISKTEGYVSINKIKFKIQSKVTKGYIYSLAFQEDPNFYKSKIFEVENANLGIQSNLNHNAILKAFSDIKNVLFENLKIKKNKIGIPKLFLKNEEQPDLFSMTHHGNYCAVVTCK